MGPGEARQLNFSVRDTINSKRSVNMIFYGADSGFGVTNKETARNGVVKIMTLTTNHRRNVINLRQFRFRNSNTYQHPKFSASPSAVVNAKIAKLLSRPRGFSLHGTST